MIRSYESYGDLEPRQGETAQASRDFYGPV